MSRYPHAAGFTLVETLIALFLASVTILAAAPLFMHAAQATAVSGDRGVVGVIAVDRMEQLRQEIWRDLIAGGSLTADVDGFFDGSDPDFLVRWQVIDNSTPTRTKTIRVIALARGNLPGPRRRVELTLIRGR
jgi:competence protein ComGC